MRLVPAAIAATLIAFDSGISSAQGDRALLRLPEPMQDHMLANRRDHLSNR